MNIKLIVTDMDGTLLNSDHKLSPYTKEVLINAQKKGIKLCLASGRSVKTLQDFGKDLEMDKYHGYFVCVNGAKITEATNLETQVLNQLQADEIQAIMRFVEPYEVEIMAVQDSSIYDYIPESLMELKKEYRLSKGIKEDVPYTAGTFDLIVDQRKGYEYIEYIKSYDDIKFEANKICIAHEPEVIAKVALELSKHFGDQFNFAKTSPRWLEVAPKGIDKANAVKTIMDKYNISDEEVLVFGDGENDLSMFAVTKYPVAMANAMDSVKEKAWKVSEEDNNHDGVARALEMHIL